MNTASRSARAAQPLPAFKEVKNITLRDQVTESVRTALMNGHFQPGQAVTVKSISEMLGVSVMPAREAMNRLIAEGALELRANRTVIVPVLSRHEFDELTDLRCHVEGQAAVHAAERAAAADIEHLREIDNGIRAAGRRGQADAYLDANFQFHFVIYRLGASDFMLSIIEKLWVRAGPLIRSCFNKTGVSDSGKHHAEIIAALAGGRTDALRAAIVADIAAAADTIRAVQAGRAAALVPAVPGPDTGAVHLRGGAQQHGLTDAWR